MSAIIDVRQRLSGSERGTTREDGRPERRSPEAEGQRFAREAQRLLQASPYAGLHRLVCTFSQGVLTVRGSVPSFYLKQLAQVALAPLRRVSRIADCIEVDLPVGRS